MAKRSLIFATRNPHKVREVSEMLNGQFDIVGLRGLPVIGALPETEGSIAGNALQKANHVHQRLGRDCFAEDTGLEVDALGGAPGVDTAHYAGPERDPQANMARLLRALEGKGSRQARFRTVIALFLGGQPHTFEGIVTGRIALAPRGAGGFGYDPIFLPEGHDLTFAQLPATVKNKISHRARALNKLIAFLQENAPA